MANLFFRALVYGFTPLGSRQVANSLKKNFALDGNQIQVVRRENRKQAMEAVQRLAPNQKFDLVIMKWPEKILEGEESFCFLANEMKIEAVAHLLLLQNLDKDLRAEYAEHFIKYHLGKGTSQGLYYTANSDKQAISEIKAIFYGNHIQEQFDNLFGTQRKPYYPCLTHPLAKLSRDIVSYWHYLTPRQQDELRKLFKINKQADPLQVSLL